MNNLSSYLETALLNHVFRGVTYTPPAAIYVALYTSNPTKMDTGQEVVGGGYVRRSVTFSVPALESNLKTIKNNADLVFPTATANWNAVTHVGLRDAATGGNLLMFGDLQDVRSILTNDIFKFLIGQLQLSLS